MFRSLVSLAFALPTLAATGACEAPVPPPGEKELIARHWGTTKGNGEFTLSGKQLTIRSDEQLVNGRSVHDVVGHTTRAPHTTRTVTGDFERHDGGEG